VVPAGPDSDASSADRFDAGVDRYSIPDAVIVIHSQPIDHIYQRHLSSARV
jgi:hypothetical protein